MPFPILGVDSDNGWEFINVYLLPVVQKAQDHLHPRAPANKNDGCHVEQKNWAVVRTVVGYHRYDTAAELLLLNEIWQPAVQAGQLLLPAAETDIKVRDGAKVSKKYDTAATPFHRAIGHPKHDRGPHSRSGPDHARINPAAAQRQIQALTTELLTLTTSKAGPKTKAPVPKRALQMRQRIRLRAHLDMRQYYIYL